MRRFVAWALLSTLVSTHALAADKGGKGKGKKKGKQDSGQSMDTTSSDPTGKEQSDAGPFTPQGKTGSLAKEEEEKKEEAKVEEIVNSRPRDTHLIFGDLLFGFGRAPKPGAATVVNHPDQTKKASPVVAFVLGGSWDLSKAVTLGLRIPWSTASVRAETPNSPNENSMAFGSPDINFEYRAELSRLTTLPIYVGVGIPIAQGNPDPSSTKDYNQTNMAQVNLLADAATGWRNAEFYQPKREPISLGVGVRHDRGVWELHAFTKLTAGIYFGEKLQAPDIMGGGGTRYRQNGLSLRDVTVVGASFEFVEKPAMWLGLDGWLAYNPILPIDFVSTATKKTPFQVVLEPRLGARFGHFVPSVGGVIPVGGQLGDTGMAGVRARLDYVW